MLETGDTQNCEPLAHVEDSADMSNTNWKAIQTTSWHVYFFDNIKCALKMSITYRLPAMIPPAP